MKNNPIIKNINVALTMDHFILISGDIKSKTRDIYHYTRLILDPIKMTVVKQSCDCEGFTYRKKCWHLETLKVLTKSQLKDEIERKREEILGKERQFLSWG
jgi:hypothetical protein